MNIALALYDQSSPQEKLLYRIVGEMAELSEKMHAMAERRETLRNAASQLRLGTDIGVVKAMVGWVRDV